ncbi:MAG: putative drug exporter of the superfamily [Actinomycetota bacterium]|nr:putative drug exporter of the superfamily [Actinomycetota bacterium]
MTRLARFVLAHRALVAVGWLVLVIAGILTVGKTVDRMTVDFSLPGQPGYETEKQIVSTYGNGPDEGSSIVTVTVPAGSTVAAEKPKVDAVFGAITKGLPGFRVISPANSEDPRFVTKDGRTAYGVVVEKKFFSFTQKASFQLVKPLLAEQRKATGFDIATTGYFELSAGDTGDTSGPSLLAETLLGALGALLILIFVFASFLALIPMVVALVSILSTFLCVLAVTYLTDVSFVVQFLIALVGLGVAIDYSLLIVNRWREERAHGRDNHDAVVEAIRTAGHTVMASAGTVAISLLALIVVPVPLLRSMGIGGLLIPLVSTAVCLTLLPVILGSIGPKVDWPRLRHENKASRLWTGWARMIAKQRWLAAGVGLIILGLIIVPVFGIKVGVPRTEALASHGSAVQTLAVLHDGGVPHGVVTPLEVLVRGDDAAGSARQVVDKLKDVDGVAFAAFPDDPTWAKDGTALVEVFPDNETVDLAQAKVVERMRSAIDDVPGYVGVAGTGATVRDYTEAVFKRFPLVMALIAFVTFLLLVRAFRSLLLPLKAVVLNVLSVAATFGFVVWFWQHGHGSEAVFDIVPTGAITFWVPVVIFGFLFGLSMDYEVFILSRMREEYDKSGSTKQAVVEGLGRTGRIVTCAALILFMAFIALAASPGTDVKVLATALGVGILLDATVVRALMVPALVSLFGRWNWYLPAWLAKPLRLEPSPAAPERDVVDLREPAAVD